MGGEPPPNKNHRVHVAGIPLRKLIMSAVCLGAVASVTCQHVHISVEISEGPAPTRQPCVSNCKPTLMANSNTPQQTSPTPPDRQATSPPQHAPADCLSCRIIGTGALGITGVYALNQARAHQPGSPVGKRVMAGVGILFLLGSVARWRT
jgi:hypothetical protein